MNTPLTPRVLLIANQLAKQLHASKPNNSWQAFNLPTAVLLIACLLSGYSIIAHAIALTMSFVMLYIQILFNNHPIIRPFWQMTYHCNNRLPWYGDAIFYAAEIAGSYFFHLWVLFAILVSLALVDNLARWKAKNNIDQIAQSIEDIGAQLESLAQTTKNAP